MNARIAGHAGTPQLKQFHMVNTKTEFPRGISDRVISWSEGESHSSTACTWSGPQASSWRINAGSFRQQATSYKPQAPSSLSIKRQASSPKQQASSLKPQASSSKILEPRKSFTAPEPRCWTKIKLFLGCLIWKLI